MIMKPKLFESQEQMGSRYESHALFVCNGCVCGYFSVIFLLFLPKGNKKITIVKLLVMSYLMDLRIKESMVVVKKTVH
jgi:hypothetical protein